MIIGHFHKIQPELHDDPSIIRSMLIVHPDKFLLAISPIDSWSIEFQASKVQDSKRPNNQ